MVCYCEYCKEYIDAQVFEEPVSFMVDGEEIFYLSKVAVCELCKEEIYVPDLARFNKSELEKALSNS